MPHALRSPKLGCGQRSKHLSTAVGNLLYVIKRRLCVAMRRANFQNSSIGANCGLYGDGNNKVSKARYFRSKGLEVLLVVPGVVPNDTLCACRASDPVETSSKGLERNCVEPLAHGAY
jgi:hypothetical protein